MKQQKFLTVFILHDSLLFAKNFAFVSCDIDG